MFAPRESAAGGFVPGGVPNASLTHVMRISYQGTAPLSIGSPRKESFKPTGCVPRVGTVTSALTHGTQPVGLRICADNSRATRFTPVRARGPSRRPAPSAYEFKKSAHAAQ